MCNWIALPSKAVNFSDKKKLKLTEIQKKIYSITHLLGVDINKFE